MAEPRPYAVRAPVPEDAPGRTEHGVAEGWRVRLELDEPDGVVAVGVSPGGEVLGFASGGPPRDDDAPLGWELYAVNVMSAAYGTGLGHDLVAAVTGDRPSHLWVLVDNARARAFYTKEGYVVDGAKKVHEASGCLEMRMVRRGQAPLG